MALTAPTAKAALARSMMRKTWLTYRMEGGPPGAIQHRFVVSLQPCRHGCRDGQGHLSLSRSLSLSLSLSVLFLAFAIRI